MSLLDLKASDMLTDPPKLDDIVVCGLCGNFSVIILTGTKLLSVEELSALHPDEQADLDFAKRAVIRKLKSN